MDNLLFISMMTMNKPTIALLHYSAPPVVGGVESVLGHHARLMADDGCSVRILAARGEQTDSRVDFVSLPKIDSMNPQVLEIKAKLDGGVVPSEFESLRGEIQRELESALKGVDILIAHNVCSLNKNLALTAALYELHRNSKPPRLILWHHDLAWTTPRYRRELHDGYPWDLLRTAWPGALQVTISKLRQRELSKLMQIPLESIHIAPNGVDRESFLKLEAQTLELSRQMQLDSAAPLLLLPVRLTRRKNIELALRALAELRKDLPQAMLVVTGPAGPHNPANIEYRKNLLALRDELGLRGAAHFVSEYSDEFLPDAVVADFYRLADALILPSREEGFGIPLIEAAFSHLPVFCADIPSLRELGGEETFFFSPDDVPAQVAALIADYFRTDPVFHFSARIRETFTWNAVYSKFITPLLQP